MLNSALTCSFYRRVLGEPMNVAIGSVDPGPGLKRWYRMYLCVRRIGPRCTLAVVNRKLFRL